MPSIYSPIGYINMRQLRTNEVPSIAIKGLRLEPNSTTTHMQNDGNHTLAYTAGDNHINIYSHQQIIQLNSMICHLGGQRLFFICPDCKHKKTLLYDVDHHYKCKNCHGIAYGSQRERPVDRLYRKARKIRRQLNVSGDMSVPITVKPKSMHWSTFNRLVRDEGYINDRVLIALGSKLEKIQRSI